MKTNKFSQMKTAKFLSQIISVVLLSWTVTASAVTNYLTQGIGAYPQSVTFGANDDFVTVNRNGGSWNLKNTSFSLFSNTLAQTWALKTNDTLVSPKIGGQVRDSWANGGVFAKSNAVLYCLGDSQTAGVNNGVSRPYTIYDPSPMSPNAPGQFLKPQYRWVSLVATNAERQLVVSNFAVGGTRISGDGSGMGASHFNAYGRIPLNWTGAVVEMCGWNNLGNENPTDAFFTMARRSHEAMIARALIDGFTAYTFIGYTDTSASAPGFSCTGGNDQHITGNLYEIPFNTIAWQYPTTKYRVSLTAGQFVQFTVAGKKAAGLFFETASTGGDVSVTVNGVAIGTWNTGFTSTMGDSYPYVVWLENLPATAVITVTGVNGTSYWDACGTVSSETYSRVRTVIYGTTVANQINSRPLDVTARMAKQSEAACGAFSGYPVYFANPWESWVNATDQEPTDGSHLTDLGNRHVADAFLSAKSVPAQKSPNVVDVGQFFKDAKAFGNSYTQDGFFGGVNDASRKIRIGANGGNSLIQFFSLLEVWGPSSLLGTWDQNTGELKPNSLRTGTGTVTNLTSGTISATNITVTNLTAGTVSAPTINATNLFASNVWKTNQMLSFSKIIPPNNNYTTGPTNLPFSDTNFLAIVSLTPQGSGPITPAPSIVSAVKGSNGPAGIFYTINVNNTSTSNTVYLDYVLIHQ